MTPDKRRKHDAMLRAQWMALWEANPYCPREEAEEACDAFVASSQPAFAHRSREQFQQELF
jgi:hypothetical protein